MKKILLIVSLFFCFKSFGQWSNYPVNQNLGNSVSTLVNTNSIKANQGIILGAFADTTVANALPYLSNYIGAMIWSNGDSSLYVRYKGATSAFWFKIGGASAGPTGRSWTVGGNLFPITTPTRDIGTLAPYGGAVGLITNSVVRAIVPDAGFTLSNDTTNTKIFTWNPTSKEWGYANWNNGGGISPSDTMAMLNRAWRVTGNTGTSTSTNWIGNNDSVAIRFRVGAREAGYISNGGFSQPNNYGINYTNAYTTYGQAAGEMLTPLLVAGSSTGRINLLIGAGAGQRLGATYNGAGTISGENILIGPAGTGAYMQNVNPTTGTGRNVIVSYSGCHSCVEPGETTTLGAFNYEMGWSPVKSTAIGSNALRTGGDSKYMTSLGAYASAYTGTVVQSVTINSSSSDWTTATATFSAPFTFGSPGACAVTATGDVVISGGQIVGITITNPGCGYSETTQTMYNNGVINRVSTAPTVTITGDGTSVTATVNTLSGNNSTALGHTSAWFSRAPQYMTYLGSGSEPSTRYWDAYGGALGYGSGIHSSISPLQKMTNAWAIGTNAKVSTDRTLTIGAAAPDTTLKVVINNHTGDSTFNVYNGGAYIERGLRVGALSSAYSGSPNVIAMTNTAGSFSNSALTQDAGLRRIRLDDNILGGTTDQASAFIVRNAYSGDATASVSALVHFSTTNSSVTTPKYMLKMSAPSLATGSTQSYILGRNESSKNMFFGTFGYVGSGSNSNYFEEAFFSAGNLRRLYASGNMTIGSAITTDNGYKLEVGGKTRITDSLWVQGGVRFSTGATNGYVLTSDADGNASWQAASGGGTPAGNFGNLQINRNGAFATPASDSLDYENSTGLTVKNNVNVEGTGKYFYGRWRARVDSTTSSATPTINTDNVDIYKLTAQAADITSMTTNLSGTPQDGDILELVITDDGTPRAITWGSSFVSTTVTLPSTTTTSVTLTVILQYYKSSSYGNNKWACVNYY